MAIQRKTYMKSRFINLLKNNKFYIFFKGVNKRFEMSFTNPRWFAYYECICDEILNTPTALSMGGWRDWENQKKKTQPIKWFLFEKLTEHFYTVIKFPKTLKWMYVEYINPKNKLKFKHLDKHYNDTSDILFYICFETFENFVNRENPFEYPERYRSYNEIADIYEWWLKRKNTNTTELANVNFMIFQLEDQIWLMRLMKIRQELWD